MHEIMTEKLNDLILEGKNEGCFPSAACAAGAGRVVLGTALVGEAPMPGDASVNVHTLYDMASLSKILGPTMVALRAIERGTLGLEECIGDFFRDVPPDKRKITVRMLMTHTAGFEPSFRLDALTDSPEDAVKAILERPLIEQPGIRPIYSCMGYILLTKMFEKRWNAAIDRLAQREVFDPLGMTETGYCPKNAVCAATEIDPISGSPLIGVVHDENARFLRGLSGNAGVFMPLCDGIRFAQMLGRMGGSYLKRSTLERAIRNETPNGDQFRGLGFQLGGTADCFMGNTTPKGCFGHTGFTGTSLMAEPKTGFWVVLLTNRVYPTRENTRLFPFRRKLHDELWKTFCENCI